MHKTEEEQKVNISVCNHPIALQNLAIMRDKNTTPELFRNATKRLAEVLFFSATDNLPVVEKAIATPMTQASVKVIDPNVQVIIAPILRAALLFSEVALNLLPDAIVQHIGLYRDDETLEPVWYYNKLPAIFENPKRTYVYILDPMLATGGSALEAIKLYLQKGIPQENIRFVCLLSVEQGIKKIHSKYPNVKVVTTWIDERLNEKGYIIPGLGDAGDRTFNTMYKVR
ncbi:MAG: uracil phosphoribosyltransferase [Candidatus Gastranaerophilales bacterium]|nr:uracil phosphoribosyltransferase [Candidatus Gastranaerophilales bacterium]